MYPQNRGVGREPFICYDGGIAFTVQPWRARRQREGLTPWYIGRQAWAGNRRISPDCYSNVSARSDSKT